MGANRPTKATPNDDAEDDAILIAAVHHLQKRGFLLSQMPSQLNVDRAKIDAAVLAWLFR